MKHDSKNLAKEVDEIRRDYAHYQTSGHQHRWRLENPGNRLIREERDRLLLQLLAAAKIDLPRAWICEIGVGHGDILRVLANAGARETQLSGFDILPERIQVAKKQIPQATLQVVDGTTFPVTAGSQDVVILATVMSSIRDEGLRQRIRDEADRMLRPGGWLLWRDMRWPNPGNRRIRPVSQRVMLMLFKDWKLVAYRSSSVLPPVIRRLGRFARPAYAVLRRVRALRTHGNGVLQKPGETSQP